MGPSHRPAMTYASRQRTQSDLAVLREWGRARLHDLFGTQAHTVGGVWLGSCQVREQQIRPRIGSLSREMEVQAIQPCCPRVMADVVVGAEPCNRIQVQNRGAGGT